MVKGPWYQLGHFFAFCNLIVFFSFAFLQFEYFVRPGLQGKWEHPTRVSKNKDTLNPLRGLTTLGNWKFYFFCLCF